MLSPLGDYGGLTQTHLPKLGSLAINGGVPGQTEMAITETALLLDQRSEGFTRGLDVGATELSPFVRVVDVEIVSNNPSVPNYDVPAGSTDQVRTVPQGNTSHGVKVTLNREVTLNSSYLTIQDSNGSETLTCAGCGTSTYTATWTSSEPFTLGTKQLKLAADTGQSSGVVGLAGDWNNPAGLSCDCGALPFPSGHDDQNVSDFEFNFTILPADVSQNNTVDFEDFQILGLNFEFGAPLIEWVDGDCDMDGSVAFGDFLVLSSVFGESLAGGRLQLLVIDGNVVRAAG